MKKRLTVLTLSAMLFALCFSAYAQQRSTQAQIGFLATVPLSTITDRLEAFRQGLRELGYTEGENILIEWRSAERNEARLPALAAELIRLKMQVIVSAGSPGTRVLKEATSTIPIVMALDPDPVGNKFVASLARPEGNITGLSLLSPEITGKQLELLKEVVSKASRVAVLGSSSRPGNAQALRETELAAAKLGLRLQYLDIRGSEDIEPAFRAATKGRAGALLVLAGPQLNSQRRQIAKLAAMNRLPAIFERAEFVDDGGLMVYGASISALSRRAAVYVDKILKGAKPSDLPVEQPTKFEFIINLKAAKQIGLTIPPNVLARADRVIK
ncbi:MAG TPA: ABC transporter substrate-binding protein [Candidatus Binatia bacterium]